MAATLTFIADLIVMPVPGRPAEMDSGTSLGNFARDFSMADFAMLICRCYPYFL